MKTQFTDDEIWKGAFYELAIELGPRSDERLQLALSAIWQMPCLTGCYRDHNREPEEQDQVEPSIVNLEIYGHLRGIAILPDQQRIPCGTVAVREEEGPDWLDFYVPLSVLMQIYKEIGGFFGTDHPKSRCWREPLENWLAGIGREVFSAVEFRLGLIGCEVSGYQYASKLTCSGVPEVRGIGYLWPTPEGVQYLTTNKW
ncbi:MAG: hypothetical protein ACYSWZ_03390 [Planctomycetota bacterium]|jgi:hypothetical protein